MKTFWMILAGVAIVVAAFFLWRRDLDNAFVSAALGLVAWLLNYRMQMKEIVRSVDLEDEKQRYEEEDVEDQDNN